MSKIILRNEEERTNDVINVLWLKIFTGFLVNTANINNLANINCKLPFAREFFNVMLAACNDLMANDRSNIPHYIKESGIEKPNELKRWLDYLKDDGHFSDKDVELLYNDYISIVEAKKNQYLCSRKPKKST